MNGNAGHETEVDLTVRRAARRAAITAGIIAAVAAGIGGYLLRPYVGGMPDRPGANVAVVDREVPTEESFTLTDSQRLVLDRLHESEVAQARDALTPMLAALGARPLSGIPKADSIELEKIIRVPERYDRQKLATDNGTDYGPISWIWPLPRIDTLKNRDFERAAPVQGQPVQAGAPVAVVYVEADVGGDDAYTKLGLTQGILCVSIAKSGNDWRAYVWPPIGSVCPADAALPSPQALGVVRHRDAATHPRGGMYPPVARWDDGTLSGRLQPTIGVRCGRQWCEIGPDGFSSDPQDLVVAAGIPANRFSGIRGWYDKQKIALRSSADAPLVPTHHAVVVPSEELGEYTEEDFEEKFLTVAFIRLDRDPAADSKYAKYGLGRTPKALKIKLVVDGAGRRRWRGKIGGKEFDVERHSHPTAEVIPAVARWAWRDDDEDLWVRCADGCCQVVFF